MIATKLYPLINASGMGTCYSEIRGENVGKVGKNLIHADHAGLKVANLILCEIKVSGYLLKGGTSASRTTQIHPYKYAMNPFVFLG